MIYKQSIRDGSEGNMHLCKNFLFINILNVTQRIFLLRSASLDFNKTIANFSFMFKDFYLKK